MKIRKLTALFAALLIIISAAVSCAQPEDTRPSRGGDVLPSGQENASSEEVPVRTEAPGTDEPSSSEGTASQSDPGTVMPQTDDTTEPFTGPETSEKTEPAPDSVTEPVTPPVSVPTAEGFRLEIAAAGTGRYCTSLLSEGTEGDYFSKKAYEGVFRTEQATGVRIVAVNGGNTSAALFKSVTTKSVSGEPFDCVIMPASAEYLLTNGLFTDLNSVPGLRFEQPWWAEGVNSEIAVNGKQFGATGDIFFDLIPNTRAILYSRGLCASRGVNVGELQSLVMSGSFTVDKFLEAARAAASSDVYGLSLDMTSGQNDNVYAVIAGSEIKVVGNSDGRFTYDYEPDRLVALGGKLLAPELKPALFSPSSHDEAVEKFTSGGLCFMNASLETAENASVAAMSVGFGFLPVPKYDLNQAEYRSFAGRSGLGIFAMPSIDSGRTGIVGAVLEFLACDAYANVRPLYEDGVLLSASSGAADPDRAVVSLIENTVCCPRYMVYATPLSIVRQSLLSEATNAFSNPSANAAAIMTGNHQTMIRYIENFNDKYIYH